MRVAICAAATLIVSACTMSPQRPAAPPTSVPSLPAPAPDDAQTIGPPVALAMPAALDDSPWPRLRRRFAMHGCDYRDEVQRWARYYTAQPRQFTASLRRAMPFLQLVVEEIERRGLPGEFAMLPYVESSYQPIATTGDRPAGMWQLVPDTARSAGLTVRADYDERLDAIASTRATLDLLERYERAFGDWRLANMAFNSGEFRVRRLIGERDPSSLSADDLAKLPFNAHTHEHLDRLLALACIVDDPSRFAVNLPEPRNDDRLRAVALDAGMDLRVAANLAGLPIDDVARWNAAYRRHAMPAAVPHRLLLPDTRIAGFTASAQALPPTLWPDWQERRADRTSTLANWAAQAGVPASALAAANGIGENATVAPTSRLLLPGREPEVVEAPSGKGRRAGVHVVQAGDTLSRIAHRYAVPLKDLKRWNPRAGGMLHLGDQVRLGLAQP